MRAYEWTDRTDKRLRTMWAAGTTVKEIAESLKTGEHPVVRRAAALGLPERLMQSARKRQAAA